MVVVLMSLHFMKVSCREGLLWSWKWVILRGLGVPLTHPPILANLPKAEPPVHKVGWQEEVMVTPGWGWGTGTMGNP